MSYFRARMKARFVRPSRSFRRSFSRSPINTSYAEAGNFNNIGFGTTVNFAILSASDAPDKDIITNLASAPAQVQNGSKIIKKGSFIKLMFAANTQRAAIGIWVYRNNKGYVTAPTDTTDFNEGPKTEDNAQLRENTVFYTRIVLSPEETRTIRVPVYSKRNHLMSDSTVLRMVIQNFQLVSGSVDYTGYGRIRTIAG